MHILSVVLTNFVCWRRPPVILSEEGVDQTQSGEPILAEAEKKKKDNFMLKDV